ncbi:hypothetical protein GCM10009617_25290 [Leifsonia poae]|uniref:Uncharacterized protein n=1 Tax=Leifsonia poae TaxID=110933 RepID=A0A9W6M0V8_9MICO|nr:hypothetical protein GCM10017584_28550 [Leifsonia poae]
MRGAQPAQSEVVAADAGEAMVSAVTTEAIRAVARIGTRRMRGTLRPANGGREEGLCATVQVTHVKALTPVTEKCAPSRI